MRIRSLTTGAALPTDEAARASLIMRLGEFARSGRAALEDAGFTVQTTRLSAQPMEQWLPSTPDALSIAAATDQMCAEEGLVYWSLGTMQTQSFDPALAGHIPEMIANTSHLFASVQVGDRQSGGINLDAVRASAAIIKALAAGSEDGFLNLRFAAAANCPPHVPFFPASYYAENEQNGGAPEFGLALEAADVAVQAFEMARSHEEARENLLALLVEQGERAAQVCARLAAEHGYTFTGLDISMAPYPEPARSSGRALEMLSGAPFGGAGTLAGATFFTGILQEARRRLPTVGYSGLMLPALEDQTLAERTTQGLVSLDTLLLVSAVCGLGLDTVPVPGDISQRQLEKIILDMAALAIRLDKPLTARLLPVPGKSAGDPVEWPDYPFFAKSTVMNVPGDDGEGLIRGSWLAI